MNKVVSVGRLTKDPDIRSTENDNLIVRFSLALNRRAKREDDTYGADFPNYVAFGKTAEFISKYFKKGMAIGVTGRLQTGSYTNKDGMRIYTTDVVVDEAEFVESKNAASDNVSSDKKNRIQKDDDFMFIPDTAEDELPWN